MSSNKDFLPSSSPISSICAIEIEAILFLFHDEVFVTSLHSKNVLQLLYWKSCVRGTSRHTVLFTSDTRKDGIPPPPVGLSWDSSHPPLIPQSLYGRTLMSESKFFGSTRYQICLPMVLCELRYNRNLDSLSWRMHSSYVMCRLRVRRA